MTSAFLLFLFFTLFSCTTALDISVPSSPVSGEPTTVTWTSDAPDDPAQFDLRFVVNNTDVGLAVANVDTGDNIAQALETGDSTSGVVNVTFPDAGPYVLIAVTGKYPNYDQIAISDDVTVVDAPTDSGTASSPTATSSSSGTPKSSSTSSPKASSSSSPIPIAASKTWNISPVKRGVIIAFSTLGVLLFLLFGAMIAFVISRRNMREAEQRKRWTFQQDKMVQQRDQQGPTMVNVGPGPEVPPRPNFDVDLERGVGLGPASPNGPRTPHYTPYHFTAAGNAGSGNQ